MPPGSIRLRESSALLDRHADEAGAVLALDLEEDGATALAFSRRNALLHVFEAVDGLTADRDDHVAGADAVLCRRAVVGYARHDHALAVLVRLDGNAEAVERPLLNRLVLLFRLRIRLGAL